MTMFRGTAYGLTIESFMPLPELAASHSDTPDVVVRSGCLEPVTTPPNGNGRSICASAREVRMSQPGVGTFLIREGREIVVDPAPDSTPEVLRLCALGPMLAVLLLQRGLCILHASAVAIRRRGVAFLGASGSGKSTTAKAFHARSHGIVADDVVAVNFNDQVPTISPAVPQLKLWPDSIGAFGEDPERLPLLDSSLSKRSQAAAENFPTAPLPLTRIYVLTQGEPARIEPVHPQQAFVEIMRHSYGASLLEGTGTTASHFQHSARLVSAGLVRRIVLRPSLAHVDEVVALVEQDVECLHR